MTSTTSSKNIKVKNFGAYFRPSFFKNINKHFTRSNVNRQLKEMNILLGFNSNSSKKSTATSKSQGKRMGYNSNSNTKSTATSKITKTKKPRKQSTPKKSPKK
tara:strand:- start:12800 stop:13108 length:309 start_codon:yes stop_codon:yes gene_type:complete